MQEPDQLFDTVDFTDCSAPYRRDMPSCKRSRSSEGCVHESTTLLGEGPSLSFALSNGIEPDVTCVHFEVVLLLEDAADGAEDLFLRGLSSRCAHGFT